MTNSKLPHSMLRCRACRTFMGWAPGRAVCIETASEAPKLPDERGLLWARCGSRSCHTWNAFEFLAVDFHDPQPEEIAA